jgi:hypothetical protein
MLTRVISELNIAGVAGVQDLGDPLGCLSN